MLINVIGVLIKVDDYWLDGEELIFKGCEIIEWL